MLEERRFFVGVVVYIIGAMWLPCIVVVACMHVDIVYMYDESWEEAEVVWYGAEMT